MDDQTYPLLAPEEEKQITAVVSKYGVEKVLVCLAKLYPKVDFIVNGFELDLLKKVGK